MVKDAYVMTPVNLLEPSKGESIIFVLIVVSYRGLFGCNLVSCHKSDPSTLFLCNDLFMKISTALLPIQLVEFLSDHTSDLAGTREQAMDSCSRPHDGAV